MIRRRKAGGSFTGRPFTGVVFTGLLLKGYPFGASDDEITGDWILTDGTWDDSGVWIDTETWNDGV